MPRTKRPSFLGNPTRERGMKTDESLANASGDAERSRCEQKTTGSVDSSLPRLPRESTQTLQTSHPHSASSILLAGVICNPSQPFAVSYDTSGAKSSCGEFPVNTKTTLNRRKERRFKTAIGQRLQCVCAVSDGQPHEGSVVDISQSGLRVLCTGPFEANQEFTVELKTDDRSLGTYRGQIRRVEPWVGGQSVLGCQLHDKVPSEVLEELARLGIINRRRDVRVSWNQPAKMSWELQPGEIDIQIEDCSLGGLRILANREFPSNVRLRIRINVGDERDAIFDTRPVWQYQREDGFEAGLAFTSRAVPAVIADMLADWDTPGTQEDSPRPRRCLRPAVLVAAVIAVLGLALKQIGLWG